MSDLEQELQDLSAQYDAELEAIAPTAVDDDKDVTAGSDSVSDVDALQQRYDALLKTNREFERVIKHQMCIIRFMGDTAQSLGVDFRDFPQDDYFNGNK
jgi:hypothetical protein